MGHGERGRGKGKRGKIKFIPLTFFPAYVWDKQGMGKGKGVSGKD